MSARIDILNRSLARKTEEIDDKISAYFDAVRCANGQPLNDKRDGHKTLAKWDRQNDSIRRLAESIEKTKAAIEREQTAERRAQEVAESLPEPIKRELDSGLLTQWRKHPQTFFVTGVDKARIVLLDDGRLAYRYAREITDADQRKKFAQTYNALRAEIAKATGEQS